MSILVTQNSEYRIENDVCTAVRPLDKDGWVTGHPAVGQKILGALRLGHGFGFAKLPAVGMRVVFSNDVMTSPVIALR